MRAWLPAVLTIATAAFAACNPVDEVDERTIDETGYLKVKVETLDAEGNPALVEDALVAMLWTKLDLSAPEDAFKWSRHTQLLGPAPTAAGPVVYDVGELPPEDAIGAISCAEAGLDYSFCTDTPGDRFAQAAIVLFRDKNGNGVLDMVNPDASGFIDEVIAIGRGADVFYVEKFENTTLRATSYGDAWGNFEPAAFEPGYHLLEPHRLDTSLSYEELLATDPCLQCGDAQQQTCFTEEEACGKSGKSEEECLEAFQLCVHPASPCADACKTSVDRPEAAVTIEVPATPEPEAGIIMCNEWPALGECTEQQTWTPLVEDCLPGGEAYFLVAEVPYNPDVLCQPQGVCTELVSLPTDKAPADWPCTIEVALMGESCDIDAGGKACHSALKCDDTSKLCVAAG